jgi:hypothetical protein
MNTDNITSLKGNNNIASQAQSITLHSVLGIIENWRANKKTRGDKIPSEVWDGIFVLLKTIPESRVLVALQITREQLNSERKERNSLVKSKIKNPKPNEMHENNTPPIEFCEVKPTFPLEYKPAKAFATNTCVVELYRPDGMLMKIHICTDSFEDLLQAFFNGDTTTC